MRTPLVRALWTVLAGAMLFLAAPAPAGAQEGGSSGNDNVGVAINQRDGSTVFRLAFKVTRATGEVVDAGNAAAAVSSCTDCQTVAIAIQIVMIVGQPDVVAPTNLAIAINEQCSGCDTLASAYQFVIQAEQRFVFTGDGRRRLSELMRQIRDLRDAGLAGGQIQAQLDVIAGEIRQVIASEIRLVGAEPPKDAADPAGTAGAAGTAGTDGTAGTEGTTTTTARPASSPSTTTTAAPTTTSSTTSSTTPSTTAQP